VFIAAAFYYPIGAATPFLAKLSKLTALEGIRIRMSRLCQTSDTHPFKRRSITFRLLVQVDSASRHRNCLIAVPVTQGTVVLVGSLPIEHLALDILVAEFGWSLKQALDLGGLAELNARDNVVAALFSPRNLELPWDQALRAVLNAAPGALPVLCHGLRTRLTGRKRLRLGAFIHSYSPSTCGKSGRAWALF
jgi:hypothetical protein